MALAVDERVHVPAARRDDARLYGVRLADECIDLVELARGPARELPQNVRPPAGLDAIALAATAWAAPLGEDGSVSARPSRHPDRWRVHVTTLIAGDGVEVSVIRRPAAEPIVARDGIGLVHRRLVRCWARRERAA